jgi:flagellum-specific peptidoglycan hydrolase FlgJ
VVNGKSVIENLEFADYDSLADSCRDYAWLVTNGTPYHVAWEQYQKDRDLPSLIAAVARVYATDPSYANLAAAVAGQANVKQAMAEARQDESSRATN